MPVLKEKRCQSLNFKNRFLFSQHIKQWVLLVIKFYLILIYLICNKYLFNIYKYFAHIYFCLLRSLGPFPTSHRYPICSQKSYFGFHVLVNSQHLQAFTVVPPGYKASFPTSSRTIAAHFLITLTRILMPKNIEFFQIFIRLLFLPLRTIF